MVAHALEIFRAKHQVSAKRRAVRPFHHVSKELLRQARAQLVNCLSSSPTFDRLGDVATRETVKHVPQLSQHEGGHMIDPAHRCPRRIFTVDGDDPLADILGEIAYALDLIGNPQDADNLAKVAGYRLTPRNDLDRPFLDIAL